MCFPICGTKPQNVSQLNSERGGTNYLLASCPPEWRSQRARPIFGRKSAFQVFEKKPDVREYVQKLKKFLEENPDPIMSTRNWRDKLVFGIMAEIRQCVEEILSLPPGWSLDRRCRLADEERCWLLSRVPTSRARSRIDVPFPGVTPYHTGMPVASPGTSTRRDRGAAAPTPWEERASGGLSARPPRSGVEST